jgi:hypothetical protein
MRGGLPEASHPRAGGAGRLWRRCVVTPGARRLVSFALRSATRLRRRVASSQRIGLFCSSAALLLSRRFTRAGRLTDGREDSGRPRGQVDGPACKSGSNGQNISRCQEVIYCGSSAAGCLESGRRAPQHHSARCGSYGHQCRHARVRGRVRGPSPQWPLALALLQEFAAGESPFGLAAHALAAEVAVHTPRGLIRIARFVAASRLEFLGRADR